MKSALKKKIVWISLAFVIAGAMILAIVISSEMKLAKLVPGGWESVFQPKFSQPLLHFPMGPPFQLKNFLSDCGDLIIVLKPLTN